MIHKNKTKKLGRDAASRKQLKRNLAKSLVRHERITTTQAKAKLVQPFIEKLITRAEDDTVANRRVVRSRLGGDEETKRLFEEISPRFFDRPGGYTRILKLNRRRGDGAQRVLIEFVE